MNKQPEISFHQARAESRTGDAVGFRVRFLSNTYDPKDPKARLYQVHAFYESPESAWQHHQKWLNGKIIADPCATDTYSVEQLKAMKMVGIYAKVEPEEPMGAALDAVLSDDSPLKGPSK